jgi:hypothetical protein
MRKPTPLAWRGVLALAVLGSSLIMVAGASAATVRVAITGSYTVAPVPTDTNPIAVDASFSGVTGDLVYTGIGTSGDTGTLTVNVPSFPFADATGPGAGLLEFHADVSQGCIRAFGNRVIVIGHLPPNEQFDIPFGHMEWVGAHLEDNSAAPGAVDRGRVFWSRTTSGQNHCNPANPNPGAAPLEALSTSNAGVSYTDQLDGFPSNPDSDVSVIDANGLSVAIADRLDPDGLEVTVGTGSGSAELSSCGTQVNVAAGSTVALTCASLIAEVITGSAEVVLGSGLVVIAIPEGGKAEVDDDGTGGFTVENLGSEPLTITVDGVETTLQPGETTTLEAWDFLGYFQPVDNMPTLNSVKAGAAVPLKWRLLDPTGAPVTDLANASITVSSLDCATGEGSDVVEQTAIVGSGLQNLGGGYYQLNWKTAKSYAGTCKTLHLDIGDGVTHDAFFDFRK